MDDVLARLRALPGVEAAGAGNMAPFVPITMIAQLDLPGTGEGERVRGRAALYVVTPGFAEALSLRLREGRLLARADLGSGVRALVVNEEFVRSYLSDGKPVVGRRFEGLVSAIGLTSEIVGVVGNVLKNGLDARPQPEVYTLPVRGGRAPLGAERRCARHRRPDRRRARASRCSCRRRSPRPRWRWPRSLASSRSPWPSLDWRWRRSSRSPSSP